MDLWRTISSALDAGNNIALATVVGVDGSAPRAAGARMIIWADGRTEGTVGGGVLEHRVTAEAVAAIAQGRPRRYTIHLTRDLGMCCGGAMDVYIEPLRPRDRLVIYGGGHVGRATAALACTLDFEVTVVDERDDYADPARFPGATAICTDPRRHAAALARDAPPAPGGGTPSPGPRTWILLVTHEHALDQDLLELLLPRSWAWLGLIGSRTKITRFFIRLRAAGVDEALFQRVSAPVGLDIGAETPEEIAVSIAAELVRTRRGVERPPSPLSSLPLPAREPRS